MTSYFSDFSTNQMNINELTPEEKQKLAKEYFGKADWAKEDGEYDECIEYCGKCIELDPDAEIAYIYRSRYIYKRAYENNCAEDYEIALSDYLNLVRIYATQQIEDPDLYDNYQGEMRKESAVLDAAWCYLQLGRYQECYDTLNELWERQKPDENWKSRISYPLKFSKERAAQNGETLQLNHAIEADFAEPLKELQ